jgi:KDO2-lipid IV(A) lauroyltransferase
MPVLLHSPFAPAFEAPTREDAIRRFWRPIKHALLLGLLALLDRTMRVLPLSLARKLGSGLGRAFCACVPYERRKTQATLGRAFPEKDEAWRRAQAAKVFAGLGCGAAEFFRMATTPPQELDSWVAQVDGFEHIERPIREGRGVVAVTAHFGNWELLASWVGRRVPVAVVAREAYDRRLDAVLNSRRAAVGLGVFSRGESVRPILRWLKDGKCLGVLADQDTGVDSLYVEVFGHPAKTPSGPAVLAQSMGADLVTGFCFRLPDGRYHLRFQAAIPMHPRAGGGPMELWPAVQEYARRTEAAIREQPESWAWNHSRWRSDILEPSTGWNPRLAEACLERIQAWRWSGRPPLA